MAEPVRRPRGWLSVNGARVEVASLEVHLGREANANTFHAEFPMTGLPAGLDVRFWCDAEQIEVQAIINDGGGGAPLFIGTVTQVRPDWDKRTLDVNGHDKTKKMMERKSLSETFKNKKAKDIIEEVAKRHGLKVKFSGDTQKAGRIYDIDTVHHPRELPDWDLLHSVADAEGLSVILDGDTLYVEPEGSGSSGMLDITYDPPTPASYARGDFITLAGVHNKSLAGKQSVKVKSYDPKARKTVEGKKTLAQATGQGKNGDGITYEYQAPGLKQDRASRIAEKRLRRATKQERQLVVGLPGSTKIRPRMGARVSGTGTKFDQSYEIESVEHRLNMEEGYRCVVTIKSATAGRKMTDE